MTDDISKSGRVKSKKTRHSVRDRVGTGKTSSAREKPCASRRTKKNNERNDRKRKDPGASMGRKKRKRGLLFAMSEKKHAGRSARAGDRSKKRGGDV